MTVTSVKQYKGSTYEVDIDGERRFYLHADIIADFAVHTGMELDRTELRKIIYASNFRRAFQYALHLLDYRDYSYSEMLKKLVVTYKSEALCTEVMKKLVRIGVIDDCRLAEKYARRLCEGKHYGLRRAREYMRTKGLSADTIDDALVPYQDCAADNIALLLETKYARFLTDADDRKSIEKVRNALVRLGYGYGEINRAVKEWFDENDPSWEDN